MISVGYNVVFTETKKIFKKYLTLDARRDIVLQNVKTKQSSTLTSAHVRCGSGLYAHMDSAPFLFHRKCFASAHEVEKGQRRQVFARVTDSHGLSFIRYGGVLQLAI